jgi:hypothetical protein
LRKKSKFVKFFEGRWILAETMGIREDENGKRIFTKVENENENRDNFK